MDKKNIEGYQDPTAYEALKAVTATEDDEVKRLSWLIILIKAASRLAGFEIINRMEFRSKSGRTYR